MVQHPVSRRYSEMAMTHELDVAGDSYTLEGKENVGTLTGKNLELDINIYSQKQIRLILV